MNGLNNDPSERREKPIEGISMSDGSAVRRGEVNYIDEVVNDAGDIAAMKAAEERIMTPRDKRVIRLLAGLNVLVLCFLGFYLATTGSGNAYKNAKGVSAFDMKTPYYDPGTVFAGELTPDLNVADFEPEVTDKFKPLLSENKDTVGWVSIDGTMIDYVVVQSDDNEYYERKDFDRNYSIKGIIFMDYRNKVAAKRSAFSKNTVLYGHRVSFDGTMFTSIENYKDIDYYKKHPVITYNTIYGDYKWKVIGAFINYPNSTSEGSDLFYYWYTDFCDENTINFANEVATRSYFINPSVNVRPSDKFLTLSTCSYLISSSGSVKGRFVVVARLVRSGEEPDVDVEQAYVNDNQRMPALWYSSRGLNNPYKDAPIWTAY